MVSGLVDQDIQPVKRLRNGIGDRIDVTVGIDDTAVRESIRGHDVAFVTSRIRITEDVLRVAPELRIVAKIGTGIDNVDLAGAREYGVTVTHTPGMNAMSVAEHTVCLLLAVHRRLFRAQGVLMRGGWRDEAPMGTRLSGSTVGIIGFGNVGKRVASCLSGFNVDLLAADPYVRAIDAELSHAELTSLEDLLRRSDAVVINAELTEETRGLVSDDELSTMKESAVLVNTARGPIVDSDSLIRALRDGRIAGAGLDVFSEEPLPIGSPLHDFENVVLTPHVAAMTDESRVDSIDRLVENTLRLLNGKSIPDHFVAVDPD